MRFPMESNLGVGLHGAGVRMHIVNRGRSHTPPEGLGNSTVHRGSAKPTFISLNLLIWRLGSRVWTRPYSRVLAPVPRVRCHFPGGLGSHLW